MLVRPERKIVDYLTRYFTNTLVKYLRLTRTTLRWSGITAEALEGVTTSLADVQKEILKHLTPPAATPNSGSTSKRRRCPILLGHSLESDLNALHLAHPRVIDTALLFHHPRAFAFSGAPREEGESLAMLKPAMKPGLAWLTRTFCGRVIQQQPIATGPLQGKVDKVGHDAEEDARACIELLRKKLEGPPGFGEVENRYETERLWERLGRRQSEGAKGKKALRCAVVDRPNGGSFAGATQHGVDVTSCSNDDEVVKGVLKCVLHGAKPTPASKEDGVAMEEDGHDSNSRDISDNDTVPFDFIWARLGELAESGGCKSSTISSPTRPTFLRVFILRLV